MGKHVLIAAPSDILRVGLKTILSSNPLVAEVSEATNGEELAEHLAAYTPDMIVIHQALVEDITALPKGRCIILTNEPDKRMFQAALEHARGYLLESTSANQLIMSLLLTTGKCFIDPGLAGWLAGVLSDNVTSPGLDAHEGLTLREQEVSDLRKSGLSNKDIAEQLCVSVNTVKSHFLHIARKRGAKRQRNKGGK